MYKQATRIKLRFPTEKGLLTAEQLWDLTPTVLGNALKAVQKVLVKDNNDELSFLETTKVVDVENQLRFDIMKDVYLTKQAEAKASLEALELKAKRQRLVDLIAKKQDEALEKLEVSELNKLLTELK